MALTLSHKKQVKKASGISDTVAFVSGMLLGNDISVRNWFAQFIRAGQKVMSRSWLENCNLVLYLIFVHLKTKRTIKYFLKLVPRHLCMVNRDSVFSSYSVFSILKTTI